MPRKESNLDDGYDGEDVAEAGVVRVERPGVASGRDR